MLTSDFQQRLQSRLHCTQGQANGSDVQVEVEIKAECSLGSEKVRTAPVSLPRMQKYA